MTVRVAEDTVRVRRFGPKVTVRVDLHGVSVTGPDGERSFVRWEWMEEIAVTKGVLVRSSRGELVLPPGAFGVPPTHLAEQLRIGRSIERRGEAIEALNRQ